MPTAPLNWGQRCNLICCYDCRFCSFQYCYCSTNPKLCCGHLVPFYFLRILLSIFLLFGLLLALGGS